MKKVRVTFGWPDGTTRTSTFTSEEDSLHFRINSGVIEVMAGNIVVSVYANMPVRAQNMDTPVHDDEGGS